MGEPGQFSLEEVRAAIQHLYGNGSVQEADAFLRAFRDSLALETWEICTVLLETAANQQEQHFAALAIKHKAQEAQDSLPHDIRAVLLERLLCILQRDACATHAIRVEITSTLGILIANADNESAAGVLVQPDTLANVTGDMRLQLFRVLHEEMLSDDLSREIRERNRRQLAVLLPTALQNITHALHAGDYTVQIILDCLASWVRSGVSLSTLYNMSLFRDVADALTSDDTAKSAASVFDAVIVQSDEHEGTNQRDEPLQEILRQLKVVVNPKSSPTIISAALMILNAIATSDDLPRIAKSACAGEFGELVISCLSCPQSHLEDEIFDIYHCIQDIDPNQRHPALCEGFSVRIFNSTLEKCMFPLDYAELEESLGEETTFLGIRERGKDLLLDTLVGMQTSALVHLCGLAERAQSWQHHEVILFAAHCVVNNELPAGFVRPGEKAVMQIPEDVQRACIALLERVLASSPSSLVEVLASSACAFIEASGRFLETDPPLAQRSFAFALRHALNARESVPIPRSQHSCAQRAFRASYSLSNLVHFAPSCVPTTAAADHLVSQITPSIDQVAHPELSDITACAVHIGAVRHASASILALLRRLANLLHDALKANSARAGDFAHAITNALPSTEHDNVREQVADIAKEIAAILLSSPLPRRECAEDVAELLGSVILSGQNRPLHQLGNILYYNQRIDDICAETSSARNVRLALETFGDNPEAAQEFAIFLDKCSPEMLDVSQSEVVLSRVFSVASLCFELCPNAMALWKKKANVIQFACNILYISGFVKSKRAILSFAETVLMTLGRKQPTLAKNHSMIQFAIKCIYEGFLPAIFVGVCTGVLEESLRSSIAQVFVSASKFSSVHFVQSIQSVLTRNEKVNKIMLLKFKSGDEMVSCIGYAAKEVESMKSFLKSFSWSS